MADELMETKTALQRMNEEMMQMREEMAEIRKEAEAKRGDAPGGFALGYVDKDFLSMGPVESLQWVSNILAPRLKAEILKQDMTMAGLNLIIGSKSPSIWTCAGFNRGGSCNAKWHVHERFCKSKPNIQFKDLRLHSCTLCYEGLGILCDHPVTDCPWIKLDTWNGLLQKKTLN